MHRRNTLSYIVIGCLSACFVFFLGLFFVSLYKGSRTRDEITAKLDAINDFAKMGRMPLSKESVDMLSSERNELKNIYSRFKLAFTSPLDEEITDEQLDPLLFKEKLIQTQKKLREDVSSCGLGLPQSLGFTKYESELSAAEQIPGLIRKLLVIEELLYLMAASEVDSLMEIGFEQEAEAKAEPEAAVPVPAAVAPARSKRARSRTAPAAEPLPAPVPKRGDVTEDHNVFVKFSIECTSTDLINFLYRLRVSPYIFVVTDMDITQMEKKPDADQALLKAGFSVMAVTVR